MTKVDKSIVEKSFELAKIRYAAMGVDVDKALAALSEIPISMHCWQGDDVTGFETAASGASGGILSTGNYPGKARNIEELRADLEKAFSLIPGKKRLNLHAIYADFSDGFVDRDKLEIKHFQSWIDWAKKNNIGLDFNPTFFSHPMAASGLTLSSPDEKVRKFWIDHAIACRKIAAEMGKQLGTPCVMNTWVPDGFKDNPIDRFAARKRLMESLDQIYSLEIDEKYLKDAVESKLFGIGVESCTVGSNEFYMGYAVSRNKLICLDSGHFHPTEVISDKISSCLLFCKEILLHVSRPVRWDSDHVVIYDDELQNIANEIVRNEATEKVHIGLDFFDGTINRLAAWAVGTRNTQKALCKALLEPIDYLREIENQDKKSERLALTEELKGMPFNAVWDYYCLSNNVPVNFDYFAEIEEYEKAVLSKRN